MCGILFHSKLDEINSEALLNLQVHRGPDENNLLEFNGYVFGHNRLSIIDLEGGTQPRQNKVTGSVLIYNGEVYNYKRLFTKYFGEANLPTSDTEAIIQLLDKIGLMVVTEFEGMFAFVYYDGTSGKYYFIRDPLGIKPLYYTNPSPGVICVSSEPKVIYTFLKKIGIELRIDESLLAEYFHYRSIPSTATLVSQVKKVSKSGIVEWDGNFVSVKNYISKPEKAYRDVHEMLRETVQDHLLADIEVGMFLSGGVDSSLVAKYMRTKSRAFTVSSSNESLSEELYAQRVADKYSLKLETIIPEEFDIQDALNDWMYYNDDPVSDPSALALFLLSKEVSKRDIKVLLAGEGADELFFGYSAYRRYLLARVFQRFFPKKICNYLLSKLSKFDRAIGDYRFGMKFMGSSHISTFEEKSRVLTNSPLVKSFYQRFQGNNKIKEFDELRSEIENRLMNDLLMRSDRATMASSLELRTPFLTNSVLAFANTYRLKELISFKQSKIPLKKALLKDFDQEFVYRKKVGFDMDVQSWLDYNLKSEVEFYLASESINGINYSGMSEIIEERKNPALVWAWLTLEKWNQRWLS